MLVNRLNL